MFNWKLSDGSAGRVVKAHEIPASYWKKYRTAHSLGAWEKAEIASRAADYVPLSYKDAVHGGGFEQQNSQNKIYARYWTWIPEEFFEPEVNEYGPISL